MTDTASRLVRHPARKRSESVLSTPKPALGGVVHGTNTIPQVLLFYRMLLAQDKKVATQCGPFERLHLKLIGLIWLLCCATEQ